MCGRREPNAEMDVEMGSIRKIIIKYEKIIVFLLIVSFFVFYSYRTGLLGSGYHLVDDHDILRISQDIKKTGFINTLYTWFLSDLHIRFRPVYWIARVTETYFLGTDWFFWHLFKAFGIGVCTYLLYFFARKMQLNVYCSLLFSGIYLFGPQCEMAWRLGPQEGLGMFFMVFSLIAAVYYHEKHSMPRLVFLMGSTAVMMGTKESFLILGPAIVLFLLYLEWGSLQEFSLKGCLRCCIRNRVYILCTGILCTVCILVIIFYVGTNSIEYAGIDQGFSLNDYKNAVWGIWSGNLRPYLHVLKYAVVLAVLLCAYYLEHEDAGRKIFLRCCELALVGYFLAAESVLYAKSGMFARYLLPVVAGIFLYTVIFTAGFFIRGRGTKFLYHIGLTVLFFSLLAKSGIGSAAAAHASDGTDTTAMLRQVSDIAKEIDGRSTDIIVSLYWGECNFSAANYLQDIYDLPKVYSIQNGSVSSDTLAYDVYQGAGEEQRDGIAVEDAQIYVEINGSLQELFQNTGIDTERMKTETIGSYTIYYSKDNNDFKGD